MNLEKNQQLRALLANSHDEVHAGFHKGYHKSRLDFYGLKAPELRRAVNQIFPRRVRDGGLNAADTQVHAAELWRQPWFEERTAAIELLTRLPKHLNAEDLTWLYAMTRECEGWALLDGLACGVISPLALVAGCAVLDHVEAWENDDWMWTRRASLLVHLHPVRKGEADLGRVFRACNKMLHEKEFFIRKAIGWLLRECARWYPAELHEYLLDARPRMSGLSLRESARNLPQPLRRDLLAK